MEKARAYFLTDPYLRDMHTSLPSPKAKVYFDLFLQYNYSCCVEHNLDVAEKTYAELCEAKKNLSESDMLFFEKHIYHGKLSYGRRERFLSTDTFDLYKDWLYEIEFPEGTLPEYENKHISAFLSKWTDILARPCVVSYCPLKYVYIAFVFDDIQFCLTPEVLDCDNDNVFEYYVDVMMSDLRKIGAVNVRYHGTVD